MGGNMRNAGNFGEIAAKNYLTAHGLEFVEMGYNTRFGELDLVMRDGGTIVFAEVKLRRDRRYGEAREFISPSKQRKLRATAQIWLAAHDPDAVCRFDAVEVYAPDGVKTERLEIIHLPDAF
ncbi:MAG: YraN family protein [Oscillospiraceae bacterium]|jgi:putative endonuclease|nr:YraN family protein [Oscillospiraceae bacterium]